MILHGYAVGNVSGGDIDTGPFIDRRDVARDSSELVDPKPISHMFDAFSDLGEYERFVVDSTDMEVEETAESALRLITADRHLLGA